MKALNWAALSKWTNEYLIGKFGQEVVHADATSDGRTVLSNGTHIHKGTRVTMTWHEYLQSVMKQERGSNNTDGEAFYALDGKPMTESYPYLAVDVSDPGLLSVGADMFQFQRTRRICGSRIIKKRAFITTLRRIYLGWCAGLRRWSS